MIVSGGRAWRLLLMLVVLAVAPEVARPGDMVRMGDRDLVLVDVEDPHGPSKPEFPKLPWEQGGRKTALCVGVSQNQFLKGWKGSDHAARGWNEALKNRGYQTTLLLDEQATRAQILASLEQMVVRAAPGDKLVFVFIGHGGQVEDRDGDEADGLDESIAPYDRDTSDPATRLTDDHLDAVFQRKQPGVKIIFVSDSCHSGTMARSKRWERGAAGPAPRFKVPGRRYEHAVLFLGSSQDDQISWSGSQWGDKPGEWMQVFSHCALKALEDTPASAQQWFDGISDLMAVQRPQQRPSLVGSDREKEEPPL